MVKSIFIMAYVTAVMVLTVMGVRALIAGEALLPTIAVLLTTAPVALFFARVMIFKNAARTSNNLPIVMLLAYAGVALAGFNLGQNGSGIQETVTAFIALTLLLAYNFWYSRLDRSTSQLTVGQKLPAFELETTNGDTVSSESFQGGPSILIFYRGNWCPLCVAQVKEMAAAYNQLKDQGARVIFVSPQPQGHTKSLAKKFGASGLEFMRDSDNQTAKKLGIFSKFGIPMGMQALGYDSDTVMPTVIISDAEGTVLWTHETDNYRVRPEPATYLAVLDGTVPAAV